MRAGPARAEHAAQHVRRVADDAVHPQVGDHWEPKDEKGPSDGGGRGRRDDTRGGVDANASKKHLYELAQRLDVPGRSSMSKDELVDAIDRANQRESARARQD